MAHHSWGEKFPSMKVFSHSERTGWLWKCSTSILIIILIIDCFNQKGGNLWFAELWQALQASCIIRPIESKWGDRDGTPSPPNPMTPTLLPFLSRPKCFSGEYVVIPAHKRGADAAISKFLGIFNAYLQYSRHLKNRVLPKTRTLRLSILKLEPTKKVQRQAEVTRIYMVWAHTGSLVSIEVCWISIADVLCATWDSLVTSMSDALYECLSAHECHVQTYLSATTILVL